MSSPTAKLFEACRANDLAGVHKILGGAPEIDLSLTVQGWTLLHMACAHRFSQVVPPILALPGIDINSLDSVGRTPLYVAAANRDMKAMALLAEDPRTDLNAGKHGNFPLLICVLQANLEGVKLLFKHPERLDRRITVVSLGASKGVLKQNNGSDILETIQILEDFVNKM